MVTDQPEYWEWLESGLDELRDTRRRLWWAQLDGQTHETEISESSGWSHTPCSLRCDDALRDRALFAIHLAGTILLHLGQVRPSEAED